MREYNHMEAQCLSLAQSVFIVKPRLRQEIVKCINRIKVLANTNCSNHTIFRKGTKYIVYNQII